MQQIKENCHVVYLNSMSIYKNPCRYLWTGLKKYNYKIGLNDSQPSFPSSHLACCSSSCPPGCTHIHHYILSLDLVDSYWTVGAHQAYHWGCRNFGFD